MKTLLKGNEAIGEGAIRAGCRHFFGYPITPQSELLHYLARRLPEAGGTFLQAESELASINMVYGAASAGARVMTSSSSPGISLMQEGISYLAAAELPCVIVNMNRGGPGLGNIAPSQSDYFQATKGGGHGDYRLIVLAPATVQEAFDLMKLAFELADNYRNPVMVLGDGVLGQVMEAVELSGREAPALPPKPWATSGADGRARNVINSIYMQPEVLEEHCRKLLQKYGEISTREKRWECYHGDDAEIVLVAYGTCARVARAAVKTARSRGIRAGLLRPVTLWPFPDTAVARASEKARSLLVVEMNTGQMVEDVRLSVKNNKPVHFYGRTGGNVPTIAEIVGRIEMLHREVASA
ncbi:MAG: 3-methyl-2-oxobutanoate dehydrogenase subunit VorB [Peptococcaceae bacterium]|nr:3-methyl-2-oxobutanoate dehydrogenase subunit VorB [Peptococcaceae bacterium]